MKYLVFLSVVMLLGSAQWLMVTSCGPTPTTTPTTTPTRTPTTTPMTTRTTTPTTSRTTTPTTTRTTTPTTTRTTTPTTTPTTTTSTFATFTVPTTEGPNAGIFINSGPLPLNTSLTEGLCSLVPSASPSVYFLRNPNYPSNYVRSQRCKIWFNTTEPRYLKVTPLTLQLDHFDKLEFYSATTTTRLDASKLNTAITLLSSSSRLTFQAGFLSLGGNFDIRVEVVNTGCHQVIMLDVRSLSILRLWDHWSSDSGICEWWLRAPAGRKVNVSFRWTRRDEMSCPRDSLVIDLSGDSRYVTQSTRYCGGDFMSPGTMESTGNALNILMDAQQHTYGIFFAIYKVV